MPVLTKDMVPGLVATGGSCRVAVEVPAKFVPGDQILVRNINPVRHTRLPRYVRGRRGVVERDHGVFVFPTPAPTARARSRSTSTA
jgi:Nitrile hydratase beta subunit